ncbi:MAG: efflux RND transporter periplasmic adaptor subunit [Gammaproteobacteria bacterium]|nr:efflux RND transporter periplasmic adaptor subunit [Gammaproteobacteria bacterium]
MDRLRHRLSIRGRTLALLGVLLPLLALLIFVALRAGPLAPVPVTVATVEQRAIAPALFGIGTVEARYIYKIGPTLAGRLLRLDVHVGDRVRAGDVLGEMDPVDLDDRIRAQEAALKRAEAAVMASEAQQHEADARKDYAQAQARRYEKLLKAHTVSEEAIESRRQEYQVALAALNAARANVAAARQDLLRVRAELKGLQQQRDNLRLIAPVAGLVTARYADPGTTIIAGAAVIDMIAPDSLWIDTRFDQLTATGMQAGLPARIVLRSRSNQILSGHVLRVEPVADAVTEETLVKIVFDDIPQPLPPLGELADVTVALPALPAQAAIPNASLQRVDGKTGVWQVSSGRLHFHAVRVLANDLDGVVQVEGLASGDQVVVYSQRTLSAHSNIDIVDRIPGVKP